MKLSLFGATGFTGQKVLAAALAAGHDVTILVRDPSRVGRTHERLTVVAGNALVREDVAHAIEGCDAVLHCLGVGGKGEGKRTTLVSDAVKILVEVMPEQGVSRFVGMSNLGAGKSGPWVVRKIIFPLFFSWIVPLIEDKNRMEAVLEQSDLDWVAFRFPNIIDGPAQETRQSADGRGISMRITDASVAALMLEYAAKDTIEDRTPAASN